MEPKVLYISGFMVLYTLGAILLPKILIIPNFIAEFVIAFLERRPMSYHKVVDVDFLVDDELFCIMMFAAWPLVILVVCIVHIIRVISASLDRFENYRFSGPKWLTLRGWVNYTNTLLGHKEQK